MAALEAEDAEARKQRWLDGVIEEFVMPGVADIDDARAALEFFRTPNPEHRVRHLETYARLRRQGVTLAGKDIAETGGLSSLSLYLRSVGFPIAELAGDFRYEIKAPDAAFDVLFSFEVFEHVKDQDPQEFDAIVRFDFSGVRRYAAEMLRILRPGGALVLTTPNAWSLIHLANKLDCGTDLLFEPHVREYAPSQVRRIMTEAGFTASHFETAFSLFYVVPTDRERDMARILDAAGASRQHRGDTAFFVFRKPAPVPHATS